MVQTASLLLRQGAEGGMNKADCYVRLMENHELLMKPEGLPGEIDVCGKCQVGMPCSEKSPLPTH